MICPFCGHNDDKVIDSRATEGGAVIRRRRECLNCEKRFTTYERVEKSARLTVVKRDGSRVPFSPDNVYKGIAAACGKRPVSEETKERIAREVEDELHLEFEREVDSRVIGQRVMQKLRETDAIAYIRFATEHLQLSTIEDLRGELDELQERPPVPREQRPLFEEEAGGAPKG